MTRLSRFFGAFRWLFVPLGLFAVVAVGVHAAADLVDDTILRLVEALDACFDGIFSAHDFTASWVDRIDARERTYLARALALAWELLADVLIAVPKLGFDEEVLPVRELLKRLNQQPTPMRVLRPLITASFTVAGAYAVSTLVESTLFVGLVGDVANPQVSAWLARVAGGTAALVVLVSHGWRAVLRSLQHADEVCRASRRPWFSGVVGTLVALPLAMALVVHAIPAPAGSASQQIVKRDESRPSPQPSPQGRGSPPSSLRGTGGTTR